jgi:murein DD-endopeptidase MepM/ murein hydrolase activator NlpD
LQLLVSFVLMALVTPGWIAKPAPRWAPRLPPVIVPSFYGHELRDPARWPAEPPPPAGPLDADRFAAAVADVCHGAAKAALAAPILDAAAAAGVDPFVLASLAFEQSGCDRRLWGRTGYGLFRLHPRMYFSNGNPPAPVTRADLAPERLLDAAHSLRVGALLLRMWEDQHADVDARFPGARHRTAISHFVWGDAVASSAAEDRVLTVRRRMLERYAGTPPAAHPTAYGIPIVSPLEGTPRLATSGIGEDRDGGARRHKGLDITGAVGEPVRSVAAGEVTFAGLDLPGGSSHLVMGPRQSARWGRRESGPGGLFVCVRHSAEVTSCYFHLRRFDVRKGDAIAAGQVIGEVGLSGVHTALPHLHFELHVDDRACNPLPALGDLVIPPRETVTYRYARAAMRARRLATVDAARATFGSDGAAGENDRLSARRRGRPRLRVGGRRLNS